MTLGAPAFTNTTPITGKRQDAHRCSAMVARDMTTLWAPHPTVLPQLEEGKKLWLPWGQRPASHLIYTVAPMKVNKPSGKSQESEYPQILLCFRLSAEWDCNSPSPGCRTVTPRLQTGLVRKGGEGGQEGLLEATSSTSTRLTEKAAPQAPKRVRLKVCAANHCKCYVFLLFSEIMPTSLEGWEWWQHKQVKQKGVDVQ